MEKEQFGSRLGFILVSAGCAIGLGNVWKFPYICGENGGAAFIVIYLACLAMMGLPMLICEYAVGRGSGKSVMKAYGFGYKNCVSAEKHTLTPEQIALLVKLKVNIVFAYDSDISYSDSEVKSNSDKLRRVTNVYVIEDTDKLLGGKEAKNSPVDCGLDIFEELYLNKRKVV